jgi:hypothetical protein
LRKFIELPATEKGTDWCESLIGGAVFKGSELQDREAAPVKAYASLQEQHRTTGCYADGEGDYLEKDHEKWKRGHYARYVEKTFPF